MFATLCRRLGAALILTLASASCAPDNLDPGAPPPAADRTYFVMGVEPDALQVMFFDGQIQNGRFVEFLPQTAKFSGAAVEGYVVGEVEGGDTLALTKMLFADGRYTWPCESSQVLVFTAPAGKVVYLTNALYYPGGNRLGVRYKADIEGARAFLKRHYPQLADRLEQGQIQYLTTNFTC